MASVTLVLGGLFGLVIGVLLFTTRLGELLQNAAVYTILNLLVN